jgi:hypothetical protein
MKMIPVITFVCVLAVSLDAQQAERELIRGMSAFAALHPAGCPSLLLEVGDTTWLATHAESTSLSYTYFGCGFTILAVGRGSIPKDDFQVVRGRTVRLLTTIEPSAQFQASGLTGTIDITWTPNGLSEFRSTGEQQEIASGLKTTFHFNSTSETADASGTFFGIPINHAVGSVSESLNHWVNTGEQNNR